VPIRDGFDSPMERSTIRGLIAFAAVLVTIAFWMPLRNSPQIAPDGGTMTETYFGLFRYATLHAVMKEPDFSMGWTFDPKRLTATVAVTVLLWVGVWFVLHRTLREAAPPKSAT
jgi:hypothetical protein